MYVTAAGVGLAALGVGAYVRIIFIFLYLNKSFLFYYVLLFNILILTYITYNNFLILQFASNAARSYATRFQNWRRRQMETSQPYDIRGFASRYVESFNEFTDRFTDFTNRFSGRPADRDLRGRQADAEEGRFSNRRQESSERRSSQLATDTVRFSDLRNNVEGSAAQKKVDIKLNVTTEQESESEAGKL